MCEIGLLKLLSWLATLLPWIHTGSGTRGGKYGGSGGGQNRESDNAFYQQIVLSFNKFQQVSQQMNGQINNSKVHYIDKAKDRRTTRLMHL